jgi:hypothetical protein
MDRMKDLLSFVIAAMAMVSLILAVYEAWSQRTGSAIVLGAIFMVATFLFYLPQLETLKAFGIEARLRSTLDRAEEIIGRLKALAEANARVTYLTLAWGNRFGSPSAAAKQNVLDDMDAQLRALKVDEAERLAIARPLVRMIGYDLSIAYMHVMERVVFWTQTLEERKMIANRTPDTQAAVQEVVNKIAAWRTAKAAADPGFDVEHLDLAAALKRETPTALLSEPQQAAATTLGAKILQLYDGCVQKGGYTTEAAEFLDKRLGENVLREADNQVKELFGIEVEFGPPR